MDILFLGVLAGLLVLLLGFVAGCDRLMMRGHAGQKIVGRADAKTGDN